MFCLSLVIISFHAIFNNTYSENMAWFEVKQLILKSSSGAQVPHREESSDGDSHTEERELERLGGETCKLLVQYNPAGL